MKKALVVLVVLFSFSFLHAQEKSNKIKEIGVSFSNLNSFGFVYRFGNENSLWRLNAILAKGYNRELTDDDYEEFDVSNQFRIKFGKEFRKSITDKLELRYGADLSLGYESSKEEVNDKTSIDENQIRESKSIIPGINLIIGFNYVLKNNIVIGLEMMPYFNYVSGSSSTNFYTETEIDISGFEYGLSTGSVMLSVSYRF